MFHIQLEWRHHFCACFFCYCSECGFRVIFFAFYSKNVQVVAGFLQARICEWHHNSENNNAVTRYYVAGFVTSNLTPHVMGLEFASEEGVMPCQC